MKLLGWSCLLMLLSYADCERLAETYYTITIKNHSSDTIRFYVGSLGSEHVYPDTLLPAEKPSFGKILRSRSGYRDSSLPWEEVFAHLPYDTLSIFILDNSVFENEEWPVIRDQYKILKRYDVSIQDLQNMDFNVTYPPDSTMDGIKMYPK